MNSDAEGSAKLICVSDVTHSGRGVHYPSSAKAARALSIPLLQ